MIQFLDKYRVNSTLTTYTINSVGFGDAHVDRVIIIAFNARTGSVGRTLQSVIVGGETADIVIQENVAGSSTGSSAIGLAIVELPTGATGSVVLTFSDSMSRVGIGVYRAIGLTSLTPHDTKGSDYTSSSDGQLPSVNIDVPANGFAIATASGYTDPDTTAADWTGLDKDWLESMHTENDQFPYTGAHKEFTSPQTGLEVGVEFTPDVSIAAALAVASWEFDTSSPTVTTQAVTSIDKTTATANGNVTDLGEEASVEAGHQFRVKNESEWTNTATQSLSATGAYTTSLTGLDPDTEYEVRSRITWDSGAEEAFGPIEEFTTLALDNPTVTTQAATAIGQGSATLNGNVTSKGDFDPVDARFQYRETGSGTWLETSLSENVETGAYTFGLSGLTPETNYEFRAKVEYDTDQEAFGSTLEFTTLAGDSAPSVTTNAMTEIRATYATANGNVTSDGGEAVTERGFVWATTTAPDVTDNKVEVAGTTGVYSVKLTDLPPETLIYLRTYAINSEGTSYGNEVSFTTLSLEDVRNPVYIKDGDNLRRI